MCRIFYTYTTVVGNIINDDGLIRLPHIFLDRPRVRWAPEIDLMSGLMQFNSLTNPWRRSLNIDIRQSGNIAIA